MTDVLVPEGRPLTGHTAAARKSLLHELRRHGISAPVSSVAVYRRAGHLELELRAGREMSHTQAERLATHVASAVRSYDRTGTDVCVLIRTSSAHLADAMTSSA